MRTVVQKFGGSSLATAELRSIAATRVLEARKRGVAPVVVCSALGRAPDPYATDSLLRLTSTGSTGPNHDMLLACGEMIAAAIFADELCALGAPARAMSGAQAGIVTDDRFGDAQIVHVEPANVALALERGIVPVVAGFQGVTSGGATTTLGRGGSDLTAMALGRALKAEIVEIFTDVSGVMTADPRRISGAHSIKRADYEEMVELAGEGAKIVHAKAAELARAARLPYVVKGLFTDSGTIIEDSRKAPLGSVTGVTAIHHVAFFRVIQGDIEDAGAQRELQVTLFGRLAESGISIDMINVNTAGIFFIASMERVEEVRSALRDLNLAVRVRPDCAKLSIVGAGMRGTSGVMYRVVEALSQLCVEIIHSTDSNITISVLVPESEAVRAEQGLHDFFHLGARSSGAATRPKEAIA
ncbi:MAG: aspartate kinase [Candidatus Eremiobacteraeota bacterium]|nr:aspartate kinase [Candidatus Eremiobacteraeota bacterium]MBV9648293.1 aspartate kinase [Candidatus Eremiobacteraeota bacterium]